MAKARPVPQGFHTLTPHLVIEGAAQAIEFYKKAFGAKEVSRMPAPDGERLMHADIVIGDSHVMLADDFPEYCDGVSRSPRKLGGSPVTLHRYVADVDAALKQAVAAGAKETMPATDMFWGDRYGKVEDPFGHDWSIATHTADLTPEEMMKAAASAFGG
jgi:uncharacterized glyoxalase superfamily protein PhnB